MPNRIKYPVIDGMKECGVCRKVKAVDQFGKTRTYFETKCKDCRKKYAAEYEKRPEVIARTKLYHQEYMKDVENRKRTNSNNRKRIKTSRYKEKRNGKRREWTAREKQKCVDYMGGKCQVCGYDKCLAALDFHHLDPTQKEGYGTGALKAHWTFERNKKEIDKCILLCVRCHREVHANIIQL